MRYHGLVAIRYALLAISLLCVACILPMEEHGGAAPKPEPSDLTFMAAGATFDGALQLARLPWYARVAGIGGLVYALRVPKWGGRYEGVSVTVPFGAWWPEATRFVVLAKKAHPACQYAGMDGIVHEGRRYGEDCR